MPFFHDMFKAPYTSLQELNLDWLLTKVKNILRFVPDDGYVGQILRRTSSGAEWSDEQGGGGAVSSVNGQTGAVVLTASDVGALPDSYTAPVDSVNGQTGAVVIGKSDVGLGNVDNAQQYSASNPPPYPVTSVNGQTGAVSLGKSDIGLGSVDDVQQYSASNPPPYPVTSVNGQTGAVTISVPANTSDLVNDSGFVDAAGASAAAPVQSVNGQTGAVVISGSGTDYIIENGTSGDWTYRKWNSGLYECWAIAEMASGTFSATGNVYYRNMPSIIFPVTFLSTPNVQVTSYFQNIGGCSLSSITLTSAAGSVLSAVSTARAVKLFIYVCGNI